MIREVTYLLSLTVLPQTWRNQQEEEGKTFLGVVPSDQDDFDGEVDLPPLDDITMGLAMDWDPGHDDVAMVEAELAAEVDEPDWIEEDVEGSAPTGAFASS